MMGTENPQLKVDQVGPEDLQQGPSDLPHEASSESSVSQEDLPNRISSYLTGSLNSACEKHGTLHRESCSSSMAFMRPPLIHAALEGNTEKIQSLMREGQNLDAQLECGTTPLMMAAKQGHAQAVKLILSAGANVNIQDQNGCTALMMTARYGHVECAQFLVNATADAGFRDADEWSAMMYAARHGYVDITRLLLKTGESVIRERTITLLNELGLDTVIDFLIDQLVETGLILAHGQKLLHFFPSIISRPGHSGKKLLEALFVEQKCPFKFQEAHLPTTAPRTHMSQLKTIELHTVSESERASRISPPMVEGRGHRRGERISSPMVDSQESRNVRENEEEEMVEDLLRADSEFIARWKRAQGQTKAEVSLFCCQISGMVTQPIVEALAEVPSIDALQTGLAHAIIEHAWRSTFMYVYLIDWLFQALVLALLVYLTSCLQQEVEAPKFPLIFISFRVLQNITDELSEAHHDFRSGSFFEYCVSCANIVDWCRIFLNCSGVVRLWQWQGTVVDRGIVGTMSAMLWFRVLYGLRPFEAFGPRILPILFAVKDTAAFAVVMLFCTAAATHAYFVIGVSDAPSLLYASFLPIYRLIWLGDFDLSELEGQDTETTNVDLSTKWLVHILFFIVCMLLTIAMMNLLVGILGANYERYEASSLPLFLRERARIMSSFSCRFYGALLWRKEWSDDVDMYLWAAMKKEPDESRSLRDALNTALRKQVTRKLSALQSEADTNKQSLKEQQKSLQTLQVSMNEHRDVLQQVLAKLGANEVHSVSKAIDA